MFFFVVVVVVVVVVYGVLVYFGRSASLFDLVRESGPIDI